MHCRRLAIAVAFAFLMAGCAGKASFDVRATNETAYPEAIHLTIHADNGDVVLNRTVKAPAYSGEMQIEHVKLADGHYLFKATTAKATYQERQSANGLAEWSVTIGVRGISFGFVVPD
jgi:hypothetical protein